jgi:hypothetical protein
VIAAYLQALSAELHVPRRTRARILAEVSDHLREAIAAGQSEAEAVEAFGDPTVLAARFQEQFATSSARRATRWTVLSVAGLGAGFALAPSTSGPSAAVIWIAAQLGVVAAVVGIARWLRYRPQRQVPASRLADLYRANGLATSCVGLVGIALIVDGGLIAGGALLAAAAVGGIAVARSVVSARAVKAAPTTENAFDDLLALARRYVPAVDALQAGAARRHPWTFCLAFAAACGLAVAAQHALVDGGVTPHAGRALLASLIIASIEAAAVIGCYAAFGRFLGIRR